MSPDWHTLETLAAVLATDPVGMGGAHVRSAHGPVRDRWIDRLFTMMGSERHGIPVPAHCAEDRLIGGLDLPATLAAGRPIIQRGLIAEADNGVLLLKMAERMPPQVISPVIAAHDQHLHRVEREGISESTPTHFAIVALDESEARDEPLNSALLDRLPLDIDLRALGPRDILPRIFPPTQIIDARRLLPRTTITDDQAAALCGAALQMGILSMRVAMATCRCARILAALDSRTSVSTSDLERAAQLILAPRALTMHEESPPEPETPPEPPEPESSKDQDDQNSSGTLEDVVLEAVASILPPGLLESLKVNRALTAGKDGQASVARQSRTLHGRPAGIQLHNSAGRARLHLLATLRSAAPWQKLRRSDVHERLQIRSSDFRYRRFKPRNPSLTVFCVDASGSAAVQRLAEAKGAVELLLADCYTRRDEVALVAFRGDSASVELPPTRSLVRAKRSLAGLPGGGGTPLAAGLESAMHVIESGLRQGRSPALVILTDGRANIDRDGNPNRSRARADAEDAARLIRSLQTPALFVDTSRRPDSRAESLASIMGARYLPLPLRGAEGISEALKQTTA